MKTDAQHRAFGTSKSVTNEKAYPYVVDIPVAAAGLDTPLNRQIMKFHESRHIQLRHGRRILRGGGSYYRWCFADVMIAHAFVEQFGGAFYEPRSTADADDTRRIAANIAKLTGS